MTSRSKSRSPQLAFYPRLATLTVLVAAASLALTSPAMAQQDAATVRQMQAAGSSAQMDEAARAHFNVAQSLYESGRFAESAREFEAAYELSHRPELLFNVYVANRDDNNLDKALPALRAYLAVMPTSLQNRVNLEARLQTMETTLAERATAAEVSEQQAAEIVAARQRAEAAERAARRAAMPPPDEGFHVSIPGVIIGGVGVAALASGLVVGALALGKVSDLEAMCPDNRCPRTASDTLSSAQTLVTTADVLIIGGSVLAAAGLTMVLFGIGAPGDSDSDAGASAMASCGPNGCFAVVTGRF